MQIKTTSDFILLQSKSKLIIIMIIIYHMLLGIPGKGNIYSKLVEYKLVQSLWKSVWKFLKILKVGLPQDIFL